MRRQPLLIAGIGLLGASIVVIAGAGFATFSASQASTAQLESARTSERISVANPVSQGSPSKPLTLPNEFTSVPRDSTPQIQEQIEGNAFGLIYVPRLRSKVWAHPLRAGIEPEQLDTGIGHFPHSVMPGEIGNFAIAGHRSTHGEPFAFIDELKAGDQVIIRTAASWFVYSLTEDRIVKPEDVWVVDPVPGKAGQAPVKALLTIVTCEPRWGSSSRWIWWGELVEVRPIADPPDEIAQFGYEPL